MSTSLFILKIMRGFVRIGRYSARITGEIGGDKLMIGPTKIGEVLNNKNCEYTSHSFFKIHTHLEAYVKRVLLIALRLKGVQYDNSVKIVESTYINTANLIDKVLMLLDSTSRKQNDVLAGLKIKYSEFFTCKTLVLEFSSIYRNRLAHGTISELKDTELLKLLCISNYAFFQSFEKLLLSEYSHSAPDCGERKEEELKQLKLRLKA